MAEEKRILYIANMSHSQLSLQEIYLTEGERNITELYGSSNFPIGILSIDSYVNSKVKSYYSEIVDLNAAFLKKIRNGELEKELEYCAFHFEEFLENELREVLEELKPQVVAISSLFDKSIPNICTLADIIKQYDEKAIVIAGGHPANNLYSYIFEHAEGKINAISFGEGEIPFAELLLSSDMHQYLTDSPYFLTKAMFKKGDYEIEQTYIQDLDEIPLFNYDRYFQKYGDEMLQMHNNVLDSNHSFNKQASIMTSRGCPYNCIFCASQKVHGHKMRKYSLERVKAEIDYWIDEKHVTTIGLMDDHLLFDVNRAIQICDYIGEKKVDIRFPNGLAIAPITKELVECMVRNNVQEVQLALESGSARVLHDIIRKPLSLEIADRVFEYFKGTNIFVKCFLVIGLPYETEADIQEGLEYLRRAEFDWCSISNPTPVSGSRLLEVALKEGILEDYDVNNASFFKPSFDIGRAFNGDLRYTINLDINFVHNAMMRKGNYEGAKVRFETLLKNYPHHAFAYYYLAQCKAMLGQDGSKDMEQYRNIVNNDSMWRSYAQYFGLEY